jgi:exopolyphosphatase / guanosine-5'-triphosphate,3'-diphosphate pyrophosphatase
MASIIAGVCGGPVAPRRQPERSATCCGAVPESPPQGREDEGMPVAVIDVGARGVRLQVFERAADDALRTLDLAVELFPLGERVFRDGLLGPAGREAICAVIDRLIARARQVPGCAVVVVATEAVRAADDRRQLEVRLARDHGVALTVLSRAEEAALVYRGARAAVGDVTEMIAAAKIGNGSLALALGVGATAAVVASLPLGIDRLRVELRLDGPPRREQLEQLRRRLRDSPWPAPGLVPDRTLLASGAARAVALAAGRLLGAPPGRLDLHVLAEIRPCLLRSARGCADRSPADLAIAATLIEETLRALGAAEAQISTSGFREGVALRELERVAAA